MGAAYYVIAILGCADGSATCAPVATLPTQYENRTQCIAATNDALAANNDFDFPTLVAECRSGQIRPAQNEMPKGAARHG